MSAQLQRDRRFEENESSRFLFLDGVRGFAALAVAFGHFGYLNSGPLAVDLFFFLSSFLLTYQLYGKFVGEKKRFKEYLGLVVAYAIKRFFRIYPLLIVIALCIQFIPIVRKAYLADPSFNAWDCLIFKGGTRDQWLKLYRPHVLWTIPLEIEYYCYIPIFSGICAYLFKVGKRKLLFLGTTIATTYFMMQVLIKAPLRRHHSPLLPHIDIFAVGSCFGVLFFELKKENIHVRRKWVKYVLEIACGFVVLLILSAREAYGIFKIWGIPIGIGPPTGYGCENTVYLFAPLILKELLVPGALSSLFQWSLLTFAGKISFSIYLDHSVLMEWIKSSDPNRNPPRERY